MDCNHLVQVFFIHIHTFCIEIGGHGSKPSSERPRSALVQLITCSKNFHNTLKLKDVKMMFLGVKSGERSRSSLRLLDPGLSIDRKSHTEIELIIIQRMSKCSLFVLQGLLQRRVCGIITLLTYQIR